MFDTTRSDLGELLYRLKYRSDVSVLDEIVQVAARFYRSWNPGATVIVPVPPSRSSRPQQPVSDRSPAPGVYTTAVSSAGARSLRMEVTQTES